MDIAEPQARELDISDLLGFNRRSDQRLDLVKIAFAEALRDEHTGSKTDVAKRVVAFADAVLAEMEKEPEAKSPTEKSERPTRTDDGDLLVR